MKNALITLLCCIVVGLSVFIVTNKQKKIDNPGNNQPNIVVQPANTAQSTIKKETAANAIETFYQFFGKYSLMLKDNIGQAKNAANQADSIKWFTEVSFENMNAEQKKDCERCRVAILDFLKNPVNTSSAEGVFLGKMIKMMFPVLVDFELNGAKAKNDGHPELASSIDAYLDLAKTILMSECKIDSNKKTDASPATKFLGEYFVMYVYIGASDERYQATPGQAALLSMHPEELTDPNERKLIEEVHKSILMLSNKLNAGEDTSLAHGRSMSAIISAMEKLKITPDDIGKTTNKSHAELAEAMLKIGK